VGDGDGEEGHHHTEMKRLEKTAMSALFSTDLKPGLTSQHPPAYPSA